MPSFSIASASARMPRPGRVLGAEVFVDDDDGKAKFHRRSCVRGHPERRGLYAPQRGKYGSARGPFRDTARRRKFKARAASLEACWFAVPRVPIRCWPSRSSGASARAAARVTIRGGKDDAHGLPPRPRRLRPQPAARRTGPAAPASPCSSSSTTRRAARTACSTATPASETFLSEIVGAPTVPGART